MTQRRVLIVEDHDIFRETLRRFLMSRYTDIVVLEAVDGQDAVACCRQQNPDVVVMDVNMPVLNGFQACDRIKKIMPGLPVVLYSSDDLASRNNDSSSEDAVVAKQFVFEQLPAQLARFLPHQT